MKLTWFWILIGFGKTVESLSAHQEILFNKTFVVCVPFLKTQKNSSRSNPFEKFKYMRANHNSIRLQGFEELYQIRIPSVQNTAIKNPSSHYRGLAIVSDSVVWIAGNRGQVIRTTNGGISWDTLYPQIENTGILELKKDFRDIFAKNKDEAIIMSAGDSAVIFRTTNGGKNWKLVYSNNQKGIFLDALEIDAHTGIGMVLGDPLSMQKPIPGNYFVGLYTIDYGNSWRELPNGDWNKPQDSLESFFAASGTSLVILKAKIDPNSPAGFKQLTVGFAGGGLHPRFSLVNFKSNAHLDQNHTDSRNKLVNKLVRPPTIQGDKIKNTGIISSIISSNLPFKGGIGWGCYGLAMGGEGRILAVGGNYLFPNLGDSSLGIANQNEDTIRWQTAQLYPNGYRSGICLLHKIPSKTLRFAKPSFHRKRHSIRLAICTGTNGTDISFDGGRTWKFFSEKGYNACGFSKNLLWMVGNNGSWVKIPVQNLIQ